MQSMSLNRFDLRTRVSMMIAAILAVIVCIGSFLVIRHVRESVEQETRSALQLAREMVETARPAGVQAHPWINLREQLSQARHVRLYILQGEESLPAPAHDTIQGVPRWFFRLVQPSPILIRQNIPTDKGKLVRIALVAHPEDEIVEAWEETRVFLGLILLLAGGTFAALYWVLGRAFQPVNAVLEGLVALEREQYSHRLPEFSQPEWRRIALAFNHCAGVLEQTRAKNRRLTRQLLKVEEEERRSLARELHDELGQVLSAIKMMALGIKQHREPKQAIDAANLITEQVDNLFDLIRTMIHKLRPLMLDDLGLAASIDTLVSNWSQHHPDVRIRLDCAEEVDAFPAEQQIHAYRIVQESLTNIFKHAQAKNVKLTLKVVSFEVPRRTWLEIRVEDDGRGTVLDKSAGFGIIGMRERVESLNGRFQCTTAPGQGFSLQVLLPFDEAQGDDHPRHACR